MKQRHAVIILFALIVVTGLTSFSSYRATERLVENDMKTALTKTLAAQGSDVISSDTIQVFNSYLQISQLRGKALLAVDTCQKGFCPKARCSVATIFSISEQRPTTVLWTLTLLWGMFCLYRRQPVSIQSQPIVCYGGITYSETDGHFLNQVGERIRLTPMQQQLMELFFRAPGHTLSKTEICDTLWPKKEDASETLYTLVRRLKPIIEQHSDLKIEAERGRAYELKVR